MIEVRNLTKKYGDHFAVQDISFSLEKGKIYGLLGPNGAGKSTTMNIMTGYIAATSGEVIIEGHDIFKEAEEAKKHIGYLPEIPPLYMDMTVWEYLFTVADLKGVPKSERKSMIGDVMEKVMITNMKDRLIKNLSKGYKQRVGIAQTLIGNPDIIILDEPTVGLDPKQIIEIITVVPAAAIIQVAPCTIAAYRRRRRLHCRQPVLLRQMPLPADLIRKRLRQTAQRQCHAL